MNFYLHMWLSGYDIPVYPPFLLVRISDFLFYPVMTANLANAASSDVVLGGSVIVVGSGRIS